MQHPSIMGAVLVEKSMELKELTDRTLELFDVKSPDQLLLQRAKNGVG